MGCDYHAPVSLTVLAIGPGSLKFQWKRDEDNIMIDDEDYTGVDEATLTIGSFSQEHKGYYSCEVTCNGKSVQSDRAKLEFSECNK